jgi:hypothetical protein
MDWLSDCSGLSTNLIITKKIMTYTTVVDLSLSVYPKQASLLSVNIIITPVTGKFNEVSMTVELPVFQSGDP